MAKREKKQAHKVVMTEGKRNIFSSCSRSMIPKQLKTFRMHLKIC